MNDLMQIAPQAAPAVEAFWEQAVELLIRWIASGLALVVFFIFIFACWVAISEGLRRDQRARCFLRLLEIGLRQGRTVEAIIESMARARIRDMGISFHLVAAWMDRGLRLGAALEEVPRFLPAPIAAMLRAGESTGDVARVIPACQAALHPAQSRVNCQANDLMVLFLASPLAPALIWVLTIYVLPRFRELAVDLGVPGNTTMEICFATSLWVGTATAALWCLFWMIETGRSGGQWLLRAVMRPLEGTLDRLNLRIPWRRKRLQRDFATTLGSMLDAGVEEARAVRLAADGTANQVLQSRAEQVVKQLAAGTGLAEALTILDDSGELQWRLRNAAHGKAGFGAALAGWRESLDARAFQQEQCFSQVVSTGFVFLNGLVVGLATVGVFHFLTTAMEAASW
jgi:hypothetical protein